MPARGEWVDLAPLEQPVLQALPRRSNRPWSADAKRIWAAWRMDPVTAMWSPSDVEYALETISLRESPLTTASEIRLRMDGLGLTPKGKRDLRWRIAPAEEGAGGSAGPTTVRHLRAVDAKAG